MASKIWNQVYKEYMAAGTRAEIDYQWINREAARRSRQQVLSGYDKFYGETLMGYDDDAFYKFMNRTMSDTGIWGDWKRGKLTQASKDRFAKLKPVYEAKSMVEAKNANRDVSGDGANKDRRIQEKRSDTLTEASSKAPQGFTGGGVAAINTFGGGQPPNRRRAGNRRSSIFESILGSSSRAEKTLLGM